MNLKTIEIEQIIIDTQHEEMSIHVEIKDNNLSYSSVINYPKKLINRILNQLQKENQEEDIYKYMQSFSINEFRTLIDFQLKMLKNRRIDFFEMEQMPLLKQIRA